jgi:hypothetical protein
MKKKGIVTRAALALLVMTSFALPASTQQRTFKNKYGVIEVVPFTAAEGVDFPAEALEALTREVALQLVDAKKFSRVLIRGIQGSDAATGPAVHLTGSVVEYAKGNRAARYFVGFGAGRSKVKAHVKFTDSSTNEVLLEDDVDGNVVMGALGGESSGALRGLAKEVAKVAKRTF